MATFVKLNENSFVNVDHIVRFKAHKGMDGSVMVEILLINGTKLIPDVLYEDFVQHLTSGPFIQSVA